MEEWEYIEETSESSLGDYRLAEYGRHGWELVSHVIDQGETVGGLLHSARVGKRHIYTFKRKKREV